MAGDISRLVDELASQIAGLRADVRAEWNTREPFSRAVIRNNISQTLSDLDESDQRALKDMNEAPRPVHWSVSISHCPSAGGWIAVPRPTQVGFDVEVKSRIQTDVVRRIAAQEECDLVPELPYLWCAKEAFFKALEDEQPRVISNLTIDSWSADKRDGIWRWQGLGPRNCQGFLLDEGKNLYALAIIF